MNINFINASRYIKPEEKKRYRKWLESVIEIEQKKAGSITYIFVGKKKIKEINNFFLNHNYITDVITFSEAYLNVVSGEIYLCLDEVKKNAIIFEGGNIKREMQRNIVHGLLHMIGYDDIDDIEKRKMKEKEDYYLGFLDNNL